MTVSELYRQSAQLGFEDSLESGDRFYFAANRALLQVALLRPAISSCVIDHTPLVNRIAGASFDVIRRSRKLCFTANNVKSYYFEADGNGELYVEGFINGGWETIGSENLSSTRRFLPYRGIIKRDDAFFDGNVRLRFAGDYVYSVRNVALYGELFSSEKADVPAYEPFTAYDISTLKDDFLSLCSSPICEDDGYTKLNQEYRVENGCKILLPYSATGVYKVLYRRKPEAIKTERLPENNNDKIDLDEELCTLLPLLVASYVWVEDEPSMAEYYAARYNERAAEILQRERNASPSIIRNTNGW